MAKSTIDQKEVEKFAAMAKSWWDENGPFKPLHIFNPVRIKYIKEKIIQLYGQNNPAKPLEGIEILDIGCGGGLISEPLCRMGAKVTGIDVTEKNIKTASYHAKESGLAIDYRVAEVGEILAEGKKFDIVVNMEVVEHVADVPLFLKQSCDLVKPGGAMFVATLNRTVKSYALAIIGAEYVLGWLPRGTHDWKKFLKPSEINNIVENNNMKLDELTGVFFNPLKQEWHLSKDSSVNYMMFFKKV